MKTDDATLTVTLADGRTISTPLEWYPRLAYGTPAERANCRLIADGEGIHWPQLDEDISVEGLIAGRKSGESASSLKRWMTIQDELRRMPQDFPELRREVLRIGPLAAEEVVRRALATIAAYESVASHWRVALALDPFVELRREGMNDQSAVVIFQAASTQAASEAKAACVAAGVADATERGIAGGEQPVFVVIYSRSIK